MKNNKLPCALWALALFTWSTVLLAQGFTQPGPILLVDSSGQVVGPVVDFEHNPLSILSLIHI